MCENKKSYENENSKLNFNCNDCGNKISAEIDQSDFYRIQIIEQETSIIIVEVYTHLSIYSFFFII